MLILPSGYSWNDIYEFVYKSIEFQSESRFFSHLFVLCALDRSIFLSYMHLVQYSFETILNESEVADLLNVAPWLN